MQLDRIALTIRSRNAWEAIDLGLSLLQRYWQDLFKIWFLLVVPFIVLLYVIFLPWLGSFAAALIVWWCKPLYDRIVLYFFSRAIFGEVPTVGQTIRALPHFLLCKHSLTALTFWRFDFARSFNLPIWQLEGLRGRIWHQRVHLLQRNSRRYAVGLTLLYIHFEWLLYIALFGLLMTFVPEIYMENMLESLFGHSEDTEWWVHVLGATFNILVLTLIEPLYVASGFTLYLNRRTDLEGWDIELLFRRIASRLQVPLLTVLFSLCIAVWVLPTTTWAAALTPVEAKQEIDTVLADEDFSTTEMVGQWIYIGDPRETSAPRSEIDWTWLSYLAQLVQNTAQLVELLLWLVVIGLIIALLTYYRRYWLPLLQWNPTKRRQLDPPPLHRRTFTRKAQQSNAFPSQPEQVAWQLWQQGEAHAAVSLLYRSALSILQQHAQVPIEDSSTEADCMRLVSRHCTAEMGQYFNHLTQQWQYLAYADRLPSEATMQALCQQWAVVFSADST